MTSAKTRIDDGVLIIMVSKIVKKYTGTTPEKARNDVKTKYDAFIRVLKTVNRWYGNSSLPRSNKITYHVGFCLSSSGIHHTSDNDVYIVHNNMQPRLYRTEVFVEAL